MPGPLLLASGKRPAFYYRYSRVQAERNWTLLAGTVVIGGFVAPVTQCFALAVTPMAVTAALLLNFEDRGNRLACVLGVP